MWTPLTLMDMMVTHSYMCAQVLVRVRARKVSTFSKISHVSNQRTGTRMWTQFQAEMRCFAYYYRINISLVRTESCKVSIHGLSILISITFFLSLQAHSVLCIFALFSLSFRRFYDDWTNGVYKKEPKLDWFFFSALIRYMLGISRKKFRE